MVDRVREMTVKKSCTGNGVYGLPDHLLFVVLSFECVCWCENRCVSEAAGAVLGAASGGVPGCSVSPAPSGQR